MIRLRLLYIIISFVGYASHSCGQTPLIDSLRQLLENSAEMDEQYVRQSLELAAELNDSDPNSAKDLAEEMLVLSRKLDYSYGIAAATYRLARTQYDLSDYDASLPNIETSLQMAEAGGFDTVLVDIYNLQGSWFNKRSRNEEAIKAYIKMQDLARQIGLRRELMAAQNNIANVYYYQGMNQEAKAAYLNVLKTAEELNDQVAQAIVYTNLSDLTSDSTGCFTNLEKALNIFKSRRMESGVGHVHMTMGDNYAKYEDPENALLHYDSAIAVFEKTGFELGVINIYVGKGTTYNKMGRPQDAIRTLEQALPPLLESGNKEILSDCYKQLSLAYKNTGNFEQALSAYEAMITARDSLFNADVSTQIAELNTKYQTEQKENQLARQELEIARQANLRNKILIGAIVAVLLTWGLFQYGRNRQKIAQKEVELAAQLERAETEKLRELDKLKSNFFANISHEFRTPLTLILSPLKQLRAGQLKGDLQKYYGIMERNGQRLMGLVNQLLDLSKLESGKMKLEIVEADLAKFIRVISHSFESLAVRKQIRYEIRLADEAIPAFFDPDKLEKILTNLLSNAFKFTPEEGSVSIEMILDSRSESHAIAVISVSDSGIGISPEHLPHIFDRFTHTVNNNDLQAGSGIGLALTRELAELHGGSLYVESRLEKGSIFTVRIAVGRRDHSDLPDEIPQATVSERSLTEQGVLPETAFAFRSEKEDSRKPLLLVVEDNQDLRKYIREQFSDIYRTLEADNGKSGLALALEKIPDLILTDLMMPEMDGTAMCKALKNDEKTSHIPVIMLTAKADREDKLQGLETGADDYLIKPFDAEELQLKVRNFIEQQRRLQEHLSGQPFSFQPENVSVSSMDEQFLQRVKDGIEKHLDDEMFSVVDLGRIVGMSRSQLHRKLKAIVGQGPNEIIREMRLLRAKELLEQQAGTASEIAFMVGFNSLAYFSRCFRQRFGITPSEVK